jgi:mannitol-1-phosphate 5-dehydrogenase
MLEQVDSQDQSRTIEKTIVIWGAGRIGRGFIADLFHAAGYRLVLVDQSPQLTAQLRQAGQFTVVRTGSGGRRSNVVISGYIALSTDQADEIAAAIARADLLAVAVFPKVFAEVIRQLVPGLLRRQIERPVAPLDILLCTNLLHPGPQFHALLHDALPPEALSYAESRIGVVETLVIRIAPDPPVELRQCDPLLVWTNGYPELPVDRTGFRGDIPPVTGLRPVDDMRTQEILKLYTYNTFHAALAYLGALRGHELISECMADPQVRAAAVGALEEAGRALAAEYGLASDEMAAWVASVITHTDNPALGDTVRRFGADPPRKLTRGDRLVGPAILARKHDIPAPYLVRTLAAALRFGYADDPGVAHVQEQIAALGLGQAVSELCGLTDAEQDLAEAIVRDYHRLHLEAEWAERARQAYELGFGYEKVYHGCGQCVLAAVLETLSRPGDPVSTVVSDTALGAVFSAATGLSGGQGLCGDATCSAFTGSVLAFGLLYPRRREHLNGDRENKYRTFAMVQRLRERFLRTYGSITCHAIHQHEMGRAFDLRDPAEREAFEAAGAHQTKCTNVVARAAQWAIEIIAEQQVEDVLSDQDTGGQGR